MYRTSPIYIGLLLASLLGLNSCILQEDVDLVVHNATIYTVDNAFSTQQAMAIKDGKIVELGPEHAIRNKYNGATTIDAGKKTVYPGLIDAHSHFLGYGLSLQKVDLTGTQSFQEVLDRVVAFSKEHPTGWVTGRGWDHTDWAIKEFPNKAALDSLFPDRPVAVRRVDGHAVLVNQVALDAAGITATTTVPGGEIQLTNGALSGILLDNAYDLVDAVIPAPDEATKQKALLQAQQNCWAVGLTTVCDAGLDRAEIELIDQMHQSGNLKMRIYAMISDKPENLDHYLKVGPYKTERLNVRSFKFYADGALGSRGACLIDPYSDIHDRTHHGLTIRDADHYRKYATELNNAGFQMNTHCIGDSATRTLLKIYAEELKGITDNRWRIEHAQVMHPDDFYLFGEYAIIPSVQPTHATSDMYWAAERLGPDRVQTAYAYKQLFEQNGIIALGTDFPVEGINPINTFYSAVFRKDANQFPESGFQPENALTREQALKGMTIWAALAGFEESEKGSLEVGKMADFVILDRDIMKAPEDQLLDTKVVYTCVGGEIVFDAKQ